MANLSLLAFSEWSGDQFAAWGWRIPFALSILLGLRRPDTGTAEIFGVPLLYLYVFVAWALLIGFMALVVERSRD